jgi:hypothetical protein
MVNDSSIEIVKSLENVKIQRDTLEREIENGEIYREKLIEKLRNYQCELERINGKEIIFKLFMIESLEEKNSVFNVYDKILKESDSAYSKVK